MLLPGRAFYAQESFSRYHYLNHGNGFRAALPPVLKARQHGRLV